MYMDITFIGQAIWFIALVFVFFAFKETNDRKLIILLAIGSWIWALHFSLLWLVAAAAINAFDVAKNCISLKYKKNTYWISFFIISYTLIGIVSFLITKNPISLLPTLTSIIWSIAVFVFHGIKLRLLMLSTLFIWFAYNFAGNSYAGMLSDFALIWATFWGIYQLLKIKK